MNALRKPIGDGKRTTLFPLMLFALFLLNGMSVLAATLKLGDILIVEPGTSSISVIDAGTGAKTFISGGGLLSATYKVVGVAVALDGDVIAVVRDRGLVRINPGTGAQSILSEGGHFKDPWAIAIDRTNGSIYVADSGYDNDRPTINGPGKIIKVDPATGAQQVLASGSPCNVFTSGMPCQNTTSAGSYLSHPYGIAIDYNGVPGTLIISDMSSFNGKGAIFRLQPVVNGTQTLLWGPSNAVPAPRVNQQAPLGCPMGVTVEPTGNILTSVFTFPVPAVPTFPPPAGTYYGCSPPGIYRIDLASSTQTILNANAPPRQAQHAYTQGATVYSGSATAGYVHKAITSGTSGFLTPNWSTTVGGFTLDGSVTWQNVGPGMNWLIPFGLDIEPAPTQGNPSAYRILVAEEGHGKVFRISSSGTSLTEAAVNLSAVTHLNVISFTPPGGTTPTGPQRTNGQPSGTLNPGTTQATLSLSTDVNATCKYSPTPGTAYQSMSSSFSSTGSVNHSTTITGLTNSSTYVYYVRCMSLAGSTNTTDYSITFSVGTPAGTNASGFAGNEAPLSEQGAWETPGSWTALQKNNGAYAISLNGQARRVSPSVPSNHYSEITYDQDPGSASWVGVTTRTQSVTNGSGYLAIAYAGEVRLYRADDTGSLSFTQLAAASASTGTAPRSLRLESQDNTHRVFFNGVQVITHYASGTVYTGGQPGIAASVFGGPTVKILSYQAGIVVDTTAPFRSNGLPAGFLPYGTTQTSISLTTDENATCRYATSAGVAYASMPNVFATTGGQTHSTTITGLTNGSSYTRYIRCQNAASIANTDDFTITFTVVSTPGTAASNFSGTEAPLSEAGAWETPGSWAALRKDNGAYAIGQNGQARRVSPSASANQYSEITYDQDPGSSSWVGVTTRTQSAANGSGYLAIAYAGEVRLYRADDTGSLSFTQLAAASVSTGTAPRSLRLESQDNTHRVFFNGVQVITHSASGTIYTGGQPGIAASVFGGPTVKILFYQAGNIVDTTAPVRSNGLPAGSLQYGTTQTSISLTTDENATCRYSTSAGVAYASMPNVFTTTGSQTHSTTITGLTNGSSYTLYIRCQNSSSIANTDDFPISFTVASSPGTATSTFSGVEAPLSESGVWEVPGSWVALQKNNGAFAIGLNGQARRVSPSVSSNQYSEITYDQDPGSSSWVGVATRVQSATNGSGYLAIAYAGEVRLYRTDDSGSLNFVQLATASASTGTSPRTLRLESQDNTHRVFFNGVQLITHSATGTVYTGGQPGIAASVFGGPTVKILSFQGGNIP